MRLTHIHAKVDGIACLTHFLELKSTGSSVHLINVLAVACIEFYAEAVRITLNNSTQLPIVITDPQEIANLQVFFNVL